MGGEVCYQAGKERGPWYEIKCIKENINSKESRNEDASFERGLLESWGKYPGWETAKDALRTLGKSKSGGVKALGGSLPLRGRQAHAEPNILEVGTGRQSPSEGE